MTDWYKPVGWKYVTTGKRQPVYLPGPMRRITPKGESSSKAFVTSRCGRVLVEVVSGHLFIVHPGYAWNGPSGPTVDTENAMKASLFHDAMYQCIHMGYWGGHGQGWLARRKKLRSAADRCFRDTLKRDGMSWARRWLWWLAVRLFGGPRCYKPQIQ